MMRSHLAPALSAAACAAAVNVPMRCSSMGYAAAAPVALNVTGLADIPLGAAVAVNELAPSCTVHDPTIATPFDVVDVVAPVTLPPPVATAKVTLTPDTGSPAASLTITAGGKFRA